MKSGIHRTPYRGFCFLATINPLTAFSLMTPTRKKDSPRKKTAAANPLRFWGLMKQDLVQNRV
ncbi:hypothetical protein C8P63_12655 [Melghirimyces profundicolus]|uniref:Uncharacterized protein n=1 Tax=Melghirimyces profundicolus TaxID=1242148 RepID=A0A2T6BCK7_9BACL|nr:hypothetical protein C8P63_12655 [Melghirimyces profundicolus]